MDGRMRALVRTSETNEKSSLTPQRTNQLGKRETTGGVSKVIILNGTFGLVYYKERHVIAVVDPQTLN